MHLALGGTMPDPGLPPSATKHVGGVGASRTVSSNENRQEREKVRDSYSWRLLRFLEVCFLFYLPSGCLWVCVYMYVYDSFYCAVKVLVVQSCLTLCDPMDCVASVHGIF